MRKATNRPFSIRRLRNLILVCLAACVAVYTAVMFSLTQRLSERFGPQVAADLAWRVQRGAQELARTTDVGLVVGDPELVTSSFGVYARSHDVRAIVALDANGTVVAQHGHAPRLDLFAGAPDVVRADRDYLISWAPAQIEGQHVGKVALVVTKRRLHDAEQLLGHAADVTLVSGLGALLLGSVIVWFFTGAVAHRDAQLSDYALTLERKVAERTQELEDIHAQLVEASHRSGMAEIASNVLHNVGNVLNSVNVSATLIGDKVKASKLPGLTKAVGVLQQHEAELGAFFASDPRGKQLLRYLSQLAEHLTADQQLMLQELTSLRQHIDHIKDIVAMQQTFARASALKEDVQLHELLEESARMNSTALARQHVELVHACDALPRLHLDRRKVLQILVNLIRNACEACEGSGRDHPRVVVRACVVNERVQISVTDNGVGIPSENLAKIFRHGFTTKPAGHGFGLHASALAATELGGALQAHSDGVGHGATFTLELPLEPAIPRAPELVAE